MSKRVLTWNALKSDGNLYSIGATYYIEADYEPVAVRIYAEVAPDVEDAEFNIYDDGTTIFGDRSSSTYYPMGGIEIQATPVTTILLMKGENNEVIAEDFKAGLLIEEGSWISCNLIKDGGGKNFTVHLELSKVSEDDEGED